MLKQHKEATKGCGSGNHQETYSSEDCTCIYVTSTVDKVINTLTVTDFN